MTRITSRQIEAFRAVLIAGSMTGAAELLGITQPAVSRLIRDLEGIVSLTLFDRRGNQVIATADAVALGVQVEDSFIGLSRIEDFASLIRSRVAGTLQLAALPTIATEVLPRFVGHFLKRHPNLRIRLDGMTSPSVVEAVAAGRADLGYASGAVDRPDLEADTIDSAAVVAMRADHPLSGKTVITPRDLAGQRLIGGARNLFQAPLDAALAGISRITLVEAAMSHVACALVAEGIGISILDPFTVSVFAGRGVVARPFLPRLPVDLCLFRRSRQSMTPLAAQFVNEFRAHLVQLADTLPPG